MREGGNKAFLLPAIFVIAAGEFTLDIFTPNGVSDWVFYFIPLLLSSYIGGRRLPYLLAGIFSVLSLVGYCLSPTDAHTNYSLAGRLVGVSAFWIIAAVISWHIKTEESLRRADRALKMISECNRLLVRTKDETALLHELCRLIVEQGGYRMTWVGFAEADKSVRIASSAGGDDGYLAKAKVRWDDNEHGRGPIGVAFRTGQLVVCNDFQTSPTTQPWHEEAAKHGYAAAIALPLKCTGKSFGVLTLYASVVDSFNTAEVALLEQLAEDLAFGIHSLRTRAEHQQAATALRESDRNYREIFNSTTEAILLHEVGTGKILDVNDATLRMFGYDSKAEVLANTVADMSAMEPAYTQMEVQHNIRRAMEEGPQTFEWQARKKNGENFWVEVSLRSSQIGGHNRVISALRDITERRKTEAQLRQLSLAVEQCPVMIVITDATGRIEYVNPKFTEVSGYTIHEVHGQNPRVFKSGHAPKEFYQQLWQTITAGQT